MCLCQRVFCDRSSDTDVPVVICDKPLDLSARINNPSSLFDLSRRAVRKCLGKRISRVSETGLSRELQCDVTKCHKIGRQLDVKTWAASGPSGGRCECGRNLPLPYDIDIDGGGREGQEC